MDDTRRVWDIEGVGRMLGGLSEVAEDVAFGEGVSLPMTSLSARLELYEATGVARLSSRDVRVEVHRVLPPAITEQGVVFTSQRSEETFSLVVRPDGFATLFIGAAAKAEPPSHESGSVLIEPETGADQPAPATAPEDSESIPRVVLTGRMGRAPTARTTSRGRTIAQAPLAVHLGRSEKPEWHTIVFFDGLAENALANLAKGQLVTIIGYKHAREIPLKDGGTRQVEEIYAAAIQPPK